MRYRLCISLITLAMAAAGTLSAQKRWTPGRTPDGQPDLQGIWTNNTLTPLERPDQFQGKPVITAKEAAEYEKKAVEGRNRDIRDPNPEVDVGKAYNDAFYDMGTRLARVDQTIRTSMVIDPPDGRVPALTPEARQKADAARTHARLHPADGPEDRSLAERCLFWPTAGPPMLPGPYNNLYQIYQSPGFVVIVTEMIHDARIIPLDGRPHLSSNVAQWLGDSVGHWESNTLVVDTTNFTAKTRFRGSDENLHVIERFTRVDQNTILYKFTIEDPTAFTKPWTGEIPLTATEGPIYEYACHEGNYAMKDILAGARAEEQKQIKK